MKHVPIRLGCIESDKLSNRNEGGLHRLTSTAVVVKRKDLSDHVTIASSTIGYKYTFKGLIID